MTLTKKKNKTGCYHCGSSHHRAKDCPTATCTHCGESGHAIGSCPNKPLPPVDRGNFQAVTRSDVCFTFVELFAGMGGFRVALEKHLGGQCVFASEVDRFCVQNYPLNFGGDRPAGDITRIESKWIPDHDLLVGGFPCQPFSSSGRQRGLDDPRGGLFREIVRILKAKQPKAFLLENVRGLMLHEGGETYKLIRQELEGSGYHVEEKLVDAKLILPQERRRLYIEGIRRDISPDTNTMLFFDLPNLQRGVKDILQGITPEDPLPNLEQLELSPHQIAKVQAQKYTQQHPEARFLSDTSQPAKTLQSSYTNYMVGSQFVATTRGGWRRFTPREAARLQGFPESFVLCQQRPYHMLGNAVAPPLIAAIVVPLLDAIGVKWKHTETSPSEHLSPTDGSSSPCDEWQRSWAMICGMLLEAAPPDFRKEELRSTLEDIGRD